MKSQGILRIINKKQSGEAQGAAKDAKKQSKKNSNGKATVAIKEAIKEEAIKVGCRKPVEHNVEAPIIKTKLTHAKTGNIRTYLQGMTSDMTENNKRWILITEITQAQSTNHVKLMREVSVIV